MGVVESLPIPVRDRALPRRDDHGTRQYLFPTGLLLISIKNLTEIQDFLQAKKGGRESR